MKNQDEILKMRASLLSVLQAFKDGVDDAKLFKILYFAQREYLVKHDLAPSFIYKSLHMSKGRLDKEPNLGAFFADIQLVGICLKCLDNSIKKHKDIDSYRLSGRSHDVTWKEAYTRAQDASEKDRMTLIDIAKAGHAKPGVIEYIKENIQIDKYLN